MKRLLLIDANDLRRETRVMLLQHAGYEVAIADCFENVERQIREARFDLVIAQTDDVGKAVMAYGERLRAANPQLPILLLSDLGLFLPKHVLLSSFAAGGPSPVEVLTRIGALLLESTHTREN